MENKFEKLKEYLSVLSMQGLCLAYSGGIDSSLLLYLCKDKNIIAITFYSIFQNEKEIEFCENFCAKYNVKHYIKNFYPLKNEILKNNPIDRCYHCKKMFFSELKTFAFERNIKNIIDGTNFDDLKTYRPGLKALLELEIISPFAKFEITKDEIRKYAKKLGLEEYNKPSNPCFATRIPYNTKLDETKIKIIQKGEEVLNNFGFLDCRLRLHDDLARIEIRKEDFCNFIEKKDEIIKQLKLLKITYITLDMEGLRQGSMDVKICKNFS